MINKYLIIVIGGTTLGI